MDRQIDMRMDLRISNSLGWFLAQYEIQHYKKPVAKDKRHSQTATVSKKQFSVTKVWHFASNGLLLLLILLWPHHAELRREFSFLVFSNLCQKYGEQMPKINSLLAKNFPIFLIFQLRFFGFYWKGYNRCNRVSQKYQFQFKSQSKLQKFKIQ